MIQIHVAHALLESGWQRDVLITMVGRTIAGVAANTSPPVGAEVLAGLAVPGVANVHSHAFQRAMAGVVERRGPADDSFWTWRELMYRFLAQITPDDIEAIAAWLYVEMLEAGFTSVGEFHYLHNAPDGSRYADPGETALRIVAAGAASGIGLCLLPTFYAHGGCGGAPPSPGQTRFLSSLDSFADPTGREPPPHSPLARQHPRHRPPFAAGRRRRSIACPPRSSPLRPDPHARRRADQRSGRVPCLVGCPPRPMVARHPAGRRTLVPYPLHPYDRTRERAPCPLAARWRVCVRSPRPIWAMASSKPRDFSTAVAALRLGPTATCASLWQRSCARSNTDSGYAMANAIGSAPPAPPLGDIFSMPCAWAAPRLCSSTRAPSPLGRTADIVILNGAHPALTARREDTMPR